MNVVHVSSHKRNRKFLKEKAGYGNASRVITWRILYSCFFLGSFRCPFNDIDSRVRHAYFCASICEKIRAAHSNMNDKVGIVPRSIVQTGDVLSTERNAARVLFCEREGQ